MGHWGGSTGAVWSPAPAGVSASDMRSSWGWLRILICLSLLWWAEASSGEQDLEDSLATGHRMEVDVSHLSTSSSIVACPTHFDQGGEEITIVPATTAAEDVTKRHFGLKVHKWRCTCQKCPDLSDDACDVSNCSENDGTAQQPVIPPAVVVRYR